MKNRLIKYSVIYIKGRPAPHPIHQKYGSLVADKEQYIDTWLKWYGQDRNKLINILAWLINALIFSLKAPKNTVFFTDGMQVPFLPVKYFSKLLFKNIKLVALVANETLYFTDTGYYKGLSLKLSKIGFRTYDHLICIGDYQYELALKFVKSNNQLSKIYNGLPQSYINLLQSHSITNNFSKDLIFVANGGTGGFRTHYKGLDLMILAFEKAKMVDPDLRFIIIGDWDKAEQARLINTVEESVQKDIIFMGAQKDIYRALQGKNIYLHCARGDAFPTTMLEAMNMGLITVISDRMGFNETVNNIDKNLVATLDVENISKALLYALKLDNETKENLSLKFKTFAKEYTEEKALIEFEKVFISFVS